MAPATVEGPACVPEAPMNDPFAEHFDIMFKSLQHPSFHEQFVGLLLGTPLCGADGAPPANAKRRKTLKNQASRKALDEMADDFWT